MKIRFFLILTMLLFFSSKAQSAIYILVDQFSPENKFPIAVADIVNQDTGSLDEESSRLTNILKHNLKLAGYFELKTVPRSLSTNLNLKPENQNYASWDATGGRVYVKGAYRKKGSKIELELRLFDPQLKIQLVGKAYKVQADEAHRAIHRFADEIMLALTGERGIFSTKIAAACGSKGKEEIVVMNVDGTDRVYVTENKHFNLSPTFSPDGKELIFTSYRSYFPELYSSRARGYQKWKKPKRLTFNKTLNITPEFSPDGKSLAFTSSMSGDPEIYLMDLSKRESKPLTQNIGIDISPTFSPDGRYLVFASERRGTLHLFVKELETNRVKRLTYTGYQNDTPSFSPRGDRLAYIKSEGGIFNVYSMNADGTDPRQLTSIGNNENPSFSPDGRYLVFSTNRDGGSNLYLMMWDGSNQMPITNDGLCKTPDWGNRLQD
ncbi:MAG: Tol-Pal system beta propeller repeat protein TolB [Deltaproteobacteria bacterium]|nr:Tol-Pal system beta propeller repeat protein TolB [Deltaproteobacteria bacterium]